MTRNILDAYYRPIAKEVMRTLSIGDSERPLKFDKESLPWLDFEL